MKEKGKVKNFLKEHKDSIIRIAIAGAVGGVVGGVTYHLGWKDCLKQHGLNVGDFVVRDKNMADVLTNATLSYPTGHDVNIGTLYDKTGLPVEKLGELGEKLKELGAPDGSMFTHYIVIGDAKK